LTSDVDGEADSTGDNLLVSLHWLISIEGRPSSDHLINKDPLQQQVRDD
jgi:hypothetical protein